MAKRLFAGVRLPDALKNRIAVAKAELEAEVGGRWIEANLHLTLKFLGPCDERQIPDIDAALSRVADTESFTVSTTIFGCFPSDKYARVFWLGLDATPEFAALHDALEREFEALGFPPEKKAFHPHVTLVRFKKPARIDTADINERLKIKEVVPMEEITLFESILSPGGANYVDLISHKLRA